MAKTLAMLLALTLLAAMVLNGGKFMLQAFTESCIQCEQLVASFMHMDHFEFVVWPACALG